MALDAGRAGRRRPTNTAGTCRRSNRRWASTGRYHGERRLRRRDGSLHLGAGGAAPGGRGRRIGRAHLLLCRCRRAAPRAPVLAAAGAAHARHSRFGAGRHRHGRRRRHRVDEPLGAAHVRAATWPTLSASRSAPWPRPRPTTRCAAPHYLYTLAEGQRRDLRVPPQGTRRARVLGGRQCGGHRPRIDRPADHFRTARHRAPPPGRGEHRAGAGLAAAHHRNRAAGDRVVRRAHAAGAATQPDGRGLLRPAAGAADGARAAGLVRLRSGPVLECRSVDGRRIERGAAPRNAPGWRSGQRWRGRQQQRQRRARLGHALRVAAHQRRRAPSRCCWWPAT